MTSWARRRGRASCLFYSAPLTPRLQGQRTCQGLAAREENLSISPRCDGLGWRKAFTNPLQDFQLRLGYSMRSVRDGRTRTPQESTGRSVGPRSALTTKVKGGLTPQHVRGVHRLAGNPRRNSNWHGVQAKGPPQGLVSRRKLPAWTGPFLRRPSPLPALTHTLTHTQPRSSLQGGEAGGSKASAQRGGGVLDLALAK